VTYTEEVTERMTKITEEVANAWLDLRMEVGEDDTTNWSTPTARRAELVEKAADIINEIEGIDAQAKRKADEQAASMKAMQDAINRTAWDMARATATPAYLLNPDPWRNVGWLDDPWSFSTKFPMSTFRSAFL
jgi:hypothetical protein